MEQILNNRLFIPVIIFLIMIVIGISKVHQAMYFHDNAHIIAGSIAVICSSAGVVLMISVIRKDNRKAIKNDSKTA